MVGDMEQIQQAAELIQRARAEESPEGNPLIGARCYIGAMEIVVSVVTKYAGEVEDVNSRKAFLSQMRSRVETYYERADLLLQVAAEMGLVEDCQFDEEESPSNLPPSLYAVQDTSLSTADQAS